jgi:hypothetical protein
MLATTLMPPITTKELRNSTSRRKYLIPMRMTHPTPINMYIIAPHTLKLGLHFFIRTITPAIQAVEIMKMNSYNKTQRLAFIMEK